MIRSTSAHSIRNGESGHLTTPSHMTDQSLCSCSATYRLRSMISWRLARLTSLSRYGHRIKVACIPSGSADTLVRQQHPSQNNLDKPLGIGGIVDIRRISWRPKIFNVDGSSGIAVIFSPEHVKLLKP